MGIIIVHSINRQFDRGLARIEISPEVRRSLDDQRIRLAGAELPLTVDERTRIAVQQAIKESFVFGFRMVMLTAAGLALISAVLAFKLIDMK